MAFIFFAAVILNPYTVFGPVGTGLGLTFFTLSIAARGTLLRPPDAFALLLAITAWGSVNGALFNLPSPLGASKVLLSTFVSVAVGYSLALMMLRFRMPVSFQTGLLWFCGAATLNGFVVLLQVLLPEVRDVVESFLVASQVDYLNSIRYRGIASAGGASLSILHALAVIISLDLAGRRCLSVSALAVITSVNGLALLFVGRTGIVLVAVGVAVLFFLTISTGQKGHARIALVSLSIAAGLLVVIFQFFLRDLVSDGQMRYAIGFMLQGSAGFQEEGTASIVLKYLLMGPRHTLGLFLGEGYGGTSGYGSRTDSGFARTVLAVGIPLAVIYYFAIVRLFSRWRGVDRYSVAVLLTLLALAEIKEPIMLSGYASRGLFLTIGMSFALASGSRASLIQEKFSGFQALTPHRRADPNVRTS